MPRVQLDCLLARPVATRAQTGHQTAACSCLRVPSQQTLPTQQQELSYPKWPSSPRRADVSIRDRLSHDVDKSALLTDSEAQLVRQSLRLLTTEIIEQQAFVEYGPNVISVLIRPKRSSRPVVACTAIDVQLGVSVLRVMTKMLVRFEQLVLVLLRGPC